jgi:hypothetical protein
MPAVPGFNRSPSGPDPERTYTVIRGFVIDLDGQPNFAPKLGAKLPGSHPAVQALFKDGFFAEVGGKEFIIVAPFVMALSGGDFAPKVGARILASHPATAALVKAGLAVPATATDEEIGAAKARAMEIKGQPAPDPYGVRLPAPIPPERRVVSTADLFANTPSGPAAWVPAGTIADSDSELVKLNREHFVPVPPEPAE